ncbi:FAD-binding oxidoreductase [Oxyplasma meridianum]|uniref:FAD-binding oxidoreductase n=1 Tax=Oxyplasma meridianum TaxID=3073602 RepID=A0AAX4NJL0_9ARCH
MEPSEAWDGNVEVPDLKTDSDLAGYLSMILKKNNFTLNPEERFVHSFGQSSLEICRMRDGIFPDIVDAVVFSEYSEIKPLLKLDLEKGFQITIYGGGTSVTGGHIFKRRGRVVSLDTKNLKEFRRGIGYVVLGAGFKGQEAENLINTHGLTLGNFPESIKFSTIGGWIATIASGQESNQYGGIENILLSAKVSRSDGEVQQPLVPRESSLLDTKTLALGSEGRRGLITEAALNTYRSPANRSFSVYFFRTFSEGINAIKKIRNLPSVIRLSDEPETMFSMGTAHEDTMKRVLRRYISARGAQKGSMLIVMNNDASALLNIPGAIYTGPRIGRKWFRERYARPYIRNELWKRGIVSDTLETSASWDNVEPLHSKVLDAFSEKPLKLVVKGSFFPIFPISTIQDLP